MKISVITACYNREKTIERAINSVLSQTYHDVEYIIIDGASNDATMTIAAKYAGRISKILSERDRGMYEAINKGIRMATGDVIGLMHSDDEFFCDQTLMQIAEAFNDSAADMVYGDGIFVDQNNPQKIVRNWISGKYKKSAVKRGWLPLHPTVYVRREVFSQAGYYDESFRIAADSDWLVRVLYKFDFKVFYLNRYIVRMDTGGLSTSCKTQRRKWAEDIRHYRAHGFNPYLALLGKVMSKVKQFRP